MGLVTVTQLIDDKLRSAALGSVLADSLVRDRAIAQAVLAYSVDSPLQVNELVTGATGSTFDVPAGWLAGTSQLEHVEFPVGLAPMATLSAAVAVEAGGDLVIMLADTSLSGDTVRVHYTLPHTLSSAASTVPAEHENALACWVAAELCLQLATQKGHERDSTIGAAAVNGQSQSGDLARRAKDWLKTYRQVLGLPDPDEKMGANASGAVTSFARTRVRGRFSSLGY